jgi:NAD(P)-dependent dehydrogenase (short-subunit alcohol dehydrogenase family)
MSGDLPGHVAIGAGRGIGAAAAAELARRGAKVVVSSRDGDAARRVAAELVAAGHDAVGIGCDVADSAAVAQLVAETLARFGRIDSLINNAAVIGPVGSIHAVDPAEWAAAIHVNLTGAFQAARAVLPALVAGGGGTIVNVSSGAAHRALEGWSAYCASKAGLAMLTKSIALEYAGAGIRVFGFGPGVVDTGMQAQVRASGIGPVAKIPQSELAPVEFPARAIAYLCGPGTEDLSGQEISIGDPKFRARAGLPE